MFVTAVVVAQQPVAVSPLDATMKKIGPATGSSIKAMLAMNYAEARKQLADVRAGLVESETFFTTRKRQDGIKFAKEALARLDEFEKALAAGEMVTPTAPEASPLDAPMKRLGAAVAAAGKAVGSRSWEDVKPQLAILRTGLQEAEAFFASRKVEMGVKNAKESLAKLTEIEAFLAAPEVDPGSVIAGMRELNTTCGGCHFDYRIRENNQFIIKPGAAPTPEQTAARNALHDLQGACTACHSTYRTAQRGEWVLRPGT
jgi:hypothetical protein